MLYSEICGTVPNTLKYLRNKNEPKKVMVSAKKIIITRTVGMLRKHRPNRSMSGHMITKVYVFTETNMIFTTIKVFLRYVCITFHFKHAILYRKNSVI